MIAGTFIEWLPREREVFEFLREERPACLRRKRTADSCGWQTTNAAG